MGFVELVGVVFFRHPPASLVELPAVVSQNDSRSHAASLSLEMSKSRGDTHLKLPTGENLISSFRLMKVRCDYDGAPQWFAVYVWSGREHLCAKHLQQRGYEVFLPCVRERRRWSDRIKVVDRPLFPGYVFCRFGDEVVGKIITVPGVTRIVGDDRGPSAIPAQEIEAVRRIVDAQLSAEPWPAPSLVGQKVLIELGPLRGITGTVLVVKNRRRLVVSVGLLPQAIAVEIDSDWITTPLATVQTERAKRSGAA